MLKNIEQQKEAELRAIVEKKERVKRLQEEAAACNRAAITAKEEARRREKALEQEIVEFQKRRDAKEAELLAEKAREREEREREIQRLREQQEKASDRQAEIDAIKAKKVQEQHELKVRATEQAARDKKQRLLKGLEDARITQFREREEKLVEQARVEREDCLKQLEKQRAAELEEKRQKETRLLLFKQNQEGVRKQMSSIQEAKKQEKLVVIEDGLQTRQKLEVRRMKMENIKADKLD